MSDATTKAALSDIHQLRLKGAELSVVRGPDAGATVSVSSAAVLIGTSDACDLCLKDRLVSRRHVEVRAEPEGIRIRDLGSSNGSYLGGIRVVDVVVDEPVTLRIGETHIALAQRAIEVPISPRNRFGEAIAHSPAMRHVFELCEKAAKTDVTVLLEGESGTGKDVLSQAIHSESARREGPFVVVDCGAIPEHLVESELFGHEKGAFTGANATRLGAFELAHGGTLFLDEIGELPMEAQPKLLRALESRSFRRVGGSQVVKVDVRVVAATNRRLKEAVRKREFREDLFYRLAVLHVSVPRLCERKEDILPLAESFLKKTLKDDDAKLPPHLEGLLLAYAWPGNARELRNVVERFATLDRTDVLFDRASVLPGDEAASVFSGLAELDYHEGKRRIIERFHREILPRVLERAEGSVPRAAELLGIPKASLYRMLNQLRDEPG